MTLDPSFSTSVGSPGWWLERLGRRLDMRQTEMVRYADYYAGRHKLAFATQKFREAFGSLFGTVADNFCEVVVDKLVERLEVQGFRFASGAATNDAAWGVWQANNLDADFPKAIRDGLIKGEFSMMVWQDSRGPRLTVEDALDVVVATDPADVHVRRAALKRWFDYDFGRMYATVYLPEATFKFMGSVVDTRDWAATPSDRRFSSGTAWERRVVEGEEWPLPNPLGVVPVVPFPNKPDLAGFGVSELKNVTAIQDVINKLLSDMLLAAEFGAFRQRWAINVELEVDKDTGKPIEPWRISQDRLLTAPPQSDPAMPEVKFGEFGQTDLAGYITAIETALKHLAVQTRMPPHYLLGSSGVWPSGESLRSAETGLVRKAQDRMRDLSEPLEEVMRLVGLVTGDTSLTAGEIETLWANPETQSESAHVDALVKLKDLGVPERGIWEMIPASPTQIARWEVLRAEEKAADEAAAEAAAALGFEPRTDLSIARDPVTGGMTMTHIPRAVG